MMPKIIKTVAMSQSDRNFVVMASWPRYPRTAIGKLPIIINQPIRASVASSMCRSFLKITFRNQAEMIRAISFLKKIRTAISVPICIIAVNFAPGSSDIPENSPKMRTWALDEIGRNSVRPWMIPKKIASSID